MDELAVDSSENPGRPGSKCGTPQVLCLVIACQERGSLGMSGPGVVSVAVGLSGGRLDASIWGGNGGDVEGAELREQTERGVRCCQEKMG